MTEAKLETICCKCGKSDWVCVEYSWDSPEHYDGVSEYRCQACGGRYGRWTGKVLAEGELEKRYGGE